MPQIENTSMLAEMLDRLPGAVFCARRNPATGEGRWLYLGDRAPEIYDVPEAELRADPNVLLTRVPEEDLAALQQAIAHSDQTGAPFTWVGRVRQRSGELRWIETHASLSRDADGMMLWYGQTFDVTERKKMELSLAASEAERARSEAFYREIIDTLPVGVMVANPAHEFVLMNRTHQGWIGGFVQEGGPDVSGTYGIFMADGVTPLPMDNTGMSRCLRGESLSEEVVIRNPRIESDLRLEVTWTPLRDQGGQVSVALGTARDVTTQRLLETELREALRHARREREGFGDLDLDDRDGEAQLEGRGGRGAGPAAFAGR